MSTFDNMLQLLIFPAGLFLLGAGLAFQWADRKLLARFQNRIGPRWFQPYADTVKLLAKEEFVPAETNPMLFFGLPMVALAGALTAALYVPLFGIRPVFSFSGDLIVTVYLLSLLTLCLGLAGAQTANRFSLTGALRGFTQLFAYEAPFILALITPALAAALFGLPAGWSINTLASSLAGRAWLVWVAPLSFVVAIIGLMGKLEMAPFDAPEAETEVVAGALTEYSGRGLALFNLARSVELVVGLALVTTLYLGGIGDGSLLTSLLFTAKMLGLLLIIVILQSALTRLRIDQTVGLWWRLGSLLVLLQWLVLLIIRGVS